MATFSMSNYYKQSTQEDILQKRIDDSYHLAISLLETNLTLSNFIQHHPNEIIKYILIRYCIRNVQLYIIHHNVLDYSCQIRYPKYICESIEYLMSNLNTNIPMISLEISRNTIRIAEVYELIRIFEKNIGYLPKSLIRWERISKVLPTVEHPTTSTST
jgi:hypothetical protein